MVLTKTKAKADQAKAALASGDAGRRWPRSTRSTRPPRTRAGSCPASAKGQQEKAFDTAVFKATKGKVEGPVKTQFGYYVFEVTKVTPKSQQSLEQATPTIKQLLQQQGEQKTLNDFVKELREEVEGPDELPQGLRGHDVQERAEAQEGRAATPPGAVPAQPQGGGTAQAARRCRRRRPSPPSPRPTRR